MCAKRYGLLIAAVGLLAQSQESLFGTWKMNAAKSKYSPGPAPKSNSAKWEAFQGGVKLTVDVGPAQGETQHWEASGKFDGKDNPVKGNNPDGDTIAFSKTDARTYGPSYVRSLLLNSISKSLSDYARNLIRSTARVALRHANRG